MTYGGPLRLASAWNIAAGRESSNVQRALSRTYGTDADLVHERLALIRRVLDTFVARFGDRPCRVFRCPGRINLRGMHVDTHGGYLNLMTRHREFVVVAAPRDDRTVTCVNIAPEFDETSFGIEAEPASPPPPGHWANYLRGCVNVARGVFPDTEFGGTAMAVGSDIPIGAALSSSSALCVACLTAILACHGKALEPEALILAARDAEWCAGSRCGVSDQAAMVLGGPNELVNIALLPWQLDTSTARRLTFPEDLEVLVVNSYTSRSLSGAAALAYNRNRFAYSLALDVLRHQMRALGWPERLVGKAIRLSNLSPDFFAEVGGNRAILGLLRAVPETISLSELRRRYELPSFDEAYERYFGAVSEDQRPKTIALRGPLLFGIAESERARVFPEALTVGDIEMAGTLMTIGHDGDRVVAPDGSAFVYDVSDAALDAFVERNVPIAQIPGAYGASSPPLDVLVDAAIQAGALGACLTGAGIAGTVLALCNTQDAPTVAEAVRQRLASPEYTRVSGRQAPLEDREVASAVVTNHATAAASELVL